MTELFLAHLRTTLASIEAEGLTKRERLIGSPQSALIRVEGREVINLCSNNYLGLCHDPRLERAAAQALARWGFGLSSVRFICGTQVIHRELERRLARFLQTDDAILYSSCFDANGGLFETLLGEQDAVISDSLNHASIIDGIRLSKAKRYRYRNGDMGDLESQLKAARSSGARRVVIATDGVFSMDGIIADLPAIRALADRYGAEIMVDDSHAVGFLGAQGRGTPEYRGLVGRIDILTGTFGKALGGASGGYVAGRQPVIDLLRQRSRPYLFSNSLAPMIVATTLAALDLVEQEQQARDRLQAHTRFFRERLRQLGFQLVPGDHPIVPVMLGDAALAQRFARELFHEGVYAVGFFYPVVPMGQARIRCQLSAAHERSQLEQAVAAFAAAAARCNLTLAPS